MSTGWLQPFRGHGLALLCALFLCLLSIVPAHAAYLITGPDAELIWSGAPAPARDNVVVTRFEELGFYRYNPDASQTFTVWSGNFADVDSLSGLTPSVTAPLPAPLDENGQPIPLNGAIPLEPSQSFAANEPVFVIFEIPLLDNSALGTRPDGRRFLALTVEIEDVFGNQTSHIITLVQESIGSDRYVGYLQPSAEIPIPDNSELRMVYDDYGEIRDSEAFQAPALVDISELALLNDRKRGQVGSGGVPQATALFLSKQASRTNVMIGDFLAYRLRLENTSGGVAQNTEIEDRLPRGFRYQRGSLRVNGQPVGDPTLDPSGRVMRIPVDDLLPGAVTELRYVVEVTVGAEPGDAVNSAIARSGPLASNVAEAGAIVERAFFDDSAFLMGRVIAGECGERDAAGVEGVRIYLEDGTNVFTDKHGRWHVEGVRPGTHVLQVDTDTLGARHTLRACDDTSRSAGNAASRFVNVQGGTLWREDFYLEEKPEVPDALQQRLTTEETEDRDGYQVNLSLVAGDQRFDEVVSEIYLSADLQVGEQQPLLDGRAFDGLTFQDNHYRLRLEPSGTYWRHTLTLPVSPVTEAVLEAEKTFTVVTRAKTPDGEWLRLRSRNIVAVAPPEMDRQNIVLRPRFGTLSAELTSEDREILDAAVEQLRTFPQLSLAVTGHTDDVPIRPRPGRVINDNYALGYARAETVALYLAEKLALDPATVQIRSAGPDEPIAGNDTPEGRARNRRVEINAAVSRRISGPEYRVIDGDSGIASDNPDSEQQDEALPDDYRGMVNIRNEMTVAQPVISVNGLLDSGLQPRLLLNGEEIPARRIGMKAVDEEKGVTRYVWIGIELFNEGDQELELQGVGPFGNVRFSDVRTITYTGAVRHIRFAEQASNIADGRTPVRVRLELKDERGRIVDSATDLRLVQSGGLQPLRRQQQDDPLNMQTDTVEVDANGYAWFEPVSDAGTYRIRLGTDEVISDEIEVAVDPHLRDWILVGFAEGSAGYNSLKDNQRALDNPEEDFYTDGEMAFFARGKVRGEWLLTAAYDSRRQRDDVPLGQAIDPEAWYVLYGDDTYRRHDAPSSDRLYVRMERRDFYVMYGDFDTGMTVTDLSRYSRVLTGAKTEYQGRHISATGFASETRQGFIRDEIAGDGTSGLYQLSRVDIVPGSERVTIEVRDRFTAELLSEQNRTRFVDYSIDYQSGTLFFRQPVAVQDENFHPIRIIVEYETENTESNLLGGGRVALHDSQKRLEVGLSGVHDDTTGAEGTLGGVDITWKPDEHHTLRAERAQTRAQVGQDRETDNAWLAEHRYTSEQIDSRVHVREQRNGFGLGQQSDTQDALRTTGGDIRYRVTQEWSLVGEASRQEVLDTGNRRDLLETRAQYEALDRGAYAGLRRAEDQSDDRALTSDQLVAGAHRQFLDQRLRLSVRGEANVNDNGDNRDYPSRLGLGADYRLTSRVNLFSAQEFSWSEDRRTSDTRAGLRATPWKGGTLSSELRQSHDEFGPRLFAHSGLYQTLDLTGGWTTDFGFDRAQTLSDRDADDESFDPQRPPASGSPRAGDYTAVFAGLGYRTAQWQFTSRVEHRDSDIDNKWNLLAGFHHRLDDADTLTGRIQHLYSRSDNGERREESAIEGSYVRRPIGADWFVLNRTRLVLDSLEDGFGDQHGTRVTNNTVANFSPLSRHQLSLQYGARYVVDSIDDQRFRGYTDLIAYEYRYDILPRWDIGTRGSRLASHESGIEKSSFGVMAGFSPVKDVWLSLGYNFRGFYDDDFDGAHGRMEGIVLDFRIKFDQSSLPQSREMSE